MVLTSAAGFLTSQLHTSVTPRGQGGRLPVAVSEGPPARLSLHVWSVFTPGGAAVWLEPVHGARGPGPPRDAPPPTQALGSPTPESLFLPVTSAARHCALPPWLSRTTVFCLDAHPCPAASQPPGQPREGSLVVKAGSVSFASFRGRGLVLLAVYGPRTSLCIFSVCRLSREWASSATSDRARTGGPGELPPAVGALHLSFFCVQSSVCWVPIFFILVGFSSFLRKGGR